jgi:hypothetical protein
MFSRRKGARNWRARATMENGTMGIILDFRRSEGAPERPRPPEGSLGEIIIFPGVRIERYASSYTPEESGAASRRRFQRSRKK